MVVSMRAQTRVLGAALTLALMMAASPAMAGDVYIWKTEDGTTAFTDDAQRIPERYRAEAHSAASGELAGYPQLTRTDSEAAELHAERLERRLDYLRSVNGSGPYAHAPAHVGAAPRQVLGGFQGEPVLRPSGPASGLVPAPRNSRVRSSDSFVPAVNFNVDPNDSAPVIVEKKRLRDRDSMSTRHVTIVSQGDRILGLIKPRVHVEPVAWGDEEDYEKY